MYMERVVLCAANAYEEKYYFNPDFSALPESIQEELQILCVMYTVEIGGIFQLYFEEDGSLRMSTEAIEADAMYDDIGGALRIKQMQEEKRELFESLELFYKVFFLNEEIGEGEISEDSGNW